MKSSQWLTLGMGFVIAGLTLRIAFSGEMPEELPQVATGAFLAIACIVWALVGLEERDK